MEAVDHFELAATGATVRSAAAIDLLAQAEIVEVPVVLPDVYWRGRRVRL